MTDKEALEIIEKEKIKHEDDDTLEIAYTHAIDALIDVVKSDKQFNEAIDNFRAVDESEVKAMESHINLIDADELYKSLLSKWHKAKDNNNSDMAIAIELCMTEVKKAPIIKVSERR